MNIKNLLGVNIPISERATTATVRKTDRSIKSEDTHDRDANGQQLFQENKKKNKMTKEQFNKALSLLNEKPFMKEMSWTAVEFVENDFYYAQVVDLAKNPIRRISEFDLWELFEEVRPGEDKKGHLLRKTA